MGGEKEDVCVCLGGWVVEREKNIQVWVRFYRFPPGGGIVLNSDKLVNLKI